MVLRTAIATALVIGLLSPAAFAQTTAPQKRGPGITRQGMTRPLGITARQRLQQRRIESGQRRGTISAAERGQLLARQRRIQAMKQRLLSSNNRLNMRERLLLHQRLNQLSRSIRRFGRGK